MQRLGRDVTRGSVLYYGNGGSPPDSVYAFDFDGTLVTRDIRHDHTESKPMPHCTRLHTVLATAYARATAVPATATRESAPTAAAPTAPTPTASAVPTPTASAAVTTRAPPEILVFSNQLGINEQGAAAMAAAIRRFEIAAGVRVRAFVATDHDRARKPFPGMMRVFRRIFPGVRVLGYCGDAAGRDCDHGDCDRKFAINCGLEFSSPEVLFGDRCLSDDAERYRIAPPPAIPTPVPLPPLPTSRKFGRARIVLLVGPPGCGKSTFARTSPALADHAIVSRDELGTVPKCIYAVKTGIVSHGAVVMDATNPSAEGRREYVRIARDLEIPIYCVVFATPIDLCIHLAGVRCYLGGGHIPQVAYTLYRKKFDPPDVQEGFDGVYSVVPEYKFEGKARRVFEYLQ